jgi:hypothetical protein
MSCARQVSGRKMAVAHAEQGADLSDIVALAFGRPDGIGSAEFHQQGRQALVPQRPTECRLDVHERDRADRWALGAVVVDHCKPGGLAGGGMSFQLAPACQAATLGEIRKRMPASRSMMVVQGTAKPEIAAQ